MKSLQLPLIVGFLSCVITTTSSGRGLGLNFAATDPDAATSSLNLADVAGVVPQSRWNNLATNNGTNVGGIVQDTGAASTATVSWASPNTWRSGANSGFPAGPNRVLLSGYLDSNNTAAGGVSITVNNIDAALRTPAYDVYVYFVGDSPADRGGGYTINDGSGAILKYGSTMAMPTVFVEDPGTDADNTLDGNYLRFRGLKGSSFTLTTNTELTTPNGFRAPVNAIQIVVVPEPATAIVACGVALLSAIAWRRRKM